MSPTLRSVLAVVFGLILGAAVILAVQALGHQVYPIPEGLDVRDPEALKAYVAEAPVGVLLFVLAAYALGSFAGGAFAGWYARRAPATHGLIVGAVLLAGGVANLLMIPHPAWFAVACVAVFVPAAYLGARLVRKPPAAA